MVFNCIFTKNCQHIIRIFCMITFFMNEWVIFNTVVDLLLKQSSAFRVLDVYMKTLTSDQTLLLYGYSYSWMKNEILLQFFSITIIAKAFGHCYMYWFSMAILCVLNLRRFLLCTTYTNIVQRMCATERCPQRVVF